jgi:D-mannonate dehydratase
LHLGIADDPEHDDQPVFREGLKTITSGRANMTSVVYKEVGYDGTLMPDHVLHVEGDDNQYQGFAFAIGYIQALIAAVSAEG